MKGSTDKLEPFADGTCSTSSAGVSAGSCVELPRKPAKEQFAQKAAVKEFLTYRSRRTVAQEFPYESDSGVGGHS